jgi:hypothetical protein
VSGGLFGGGGGGSDNTSGASAGGSGAVRVIWTGRNANYSLRFFPAYNTQNINDFDKFFNR